VRAWVVERPAPIDAGPLVRVDREPPEPAPEHPARRRGVLRLADRLGVRATTTAYPMDDAPQALADLAHGRFGGAAVLVNEAAT
jgi:hypothetical protein